MRCIKEHLLLDADFKNIVIFRAKNEDSGCQDEQETRKGDGRPCYSSIEIQYEDQSEDSGNPARRAQISHIGSRIEHATIAGDWLWLRDKRGKRWRYLVGPQPLKQMLAWRWKETKSRSRTPSTCETDPLCKQHIETCDPAAGWLVSQDTGQCGH